MAYTQASTQENKLSSTWSSAGAPLNFLEDLKLLLKEGLAKFCPIGIVPREYEALQLCLSPGEPGTQGHYLLVGLSTLSGHMRLRDVLLFQPVFLQVAAPLVHPWHEPPFLAPFAPDTIDTPRDQRTPGEAATYLKSRFRLKPQQGKRAKELRWVTTYLTSEPTEDTPPKYADWEACASLFVAIDIFTHADGIRRSGFEGEPEETAKGLLVLVAYALQYLHKRGPQTQTQTPPLSRNWRRVSHSVRFKNGPCKPDYARSYVILSATRTPFSTLGD
jgi:hypothetical protein